MILADLASRAQTARRSSGTATRPIFASRVENGYFVASAAAVAVSALNKADLPTFGRPTMPQLKPIQIAFLTGEKAARPPRARSDDLESGRERRRMAALCGIRSDGP